MVQAHASQCGFCTPGFVMSLFALYKQQAGRQSAAPGPRDTLLEALGGNLCRCTGYRPIVEAAQAALCEADRDRFTAQQQGTVDTLRAIEAVSSHSEALRGKHGAYHRPQSADEVASLLAQHPDARLLAGGTDLFLERTQALKALPRLIDLRAAADLDRLSIDESQLSIGAAVTHRGAQDAVLDEYPELAELILRFGSLQIRSQGTVVGNIANASPVGDWPPVLLALGASLTLQSGRGTRQLPLQSFFLGYRKTALQPGEFIRSVELPRRPADLFLRAYKVTKRYEDDISSLCGVFAIHGKAESRRVRVAFGGMAAMPRRAEHCEQALLGRELDQAAVGDGMQALSDDFRPISDARASAGYRLRVAQNLLRRLQLERAGGVETRCHSIHDPRAAHA
jgi:xanthine dehydrogenase small subunit